MPLLQEAVLSLSASYPPAADRRTGDLQHLSGQFTELIGVLHRLKSQLASAGGVERARERAAHVLLFPLCAAGPLRQGDLAELVHADPSTVSRHVALLVEQGLVRRVADERDGRVSRLVVTADGREAVAAMRREREVLLGRVLDGWPDEDLSAFTRLLHRFATDLSDHVPASTTGAGTPDTSSEKDR